MYLEHILDIHVHILHIRVNTYMFQYVNDNMNSQISRIHTALVVDGCECKYKFNSSYMAGR